MQYFSDYVNNLQDTLSSGSAKEHSYRYAVKQLIESINDEITVINEPSYTDGNAPDFLFKKGDVDIAYAECKDIDKDINDKETQKQAKRYVQAFGKILLTNYLDFQIIDETGLVAEFSIGTRDGSNLFVEKASFESANNYIADYLRPTPKSINSAKKLASIMAAKGRILRDVAMASLKENQGSEIYGQYKTFKEVLIHDLKEEDFADMYAQTIVYGLFVARYYDPTLPTFSRDEAHKLLPSTNPLLKKFFLHVAASDYDEKVAWLIDSLIETYLATDVSGLMHKEFEKKQKDPVLHFYETFLGEYDQKLRKSRGVYYTPEPVVSFIVRGIDQILKEKFGLADGLADTSQIEHEFKVAQSDGRTTDGLKKIKQNIHKVQILDPALGTGTFLNEVIYEIHRSFKGQEGLWGGYVNEHLLPRLHGFELMMASYTMAHLKLGITLSELGYKGNDRLSVWLTNSLEESVHEVPSLFMSQWLTDESNQASKIKSEMPIMVVLGNPPYSGISSNNGDEALRLADKYKIEPGGKQKLQERKHWLNDDYVKFISFAEDQIKKTGEGVFSYINPHGFIDNPTFRGMRWHLLDTFDEIYILDLHGNSKKKETAPDGGKDENVFDIQQGVSIIFAIKQKENTNDLAKVFHADLYGKRDIKYQDLDKEFNEIDWQEVDYREPDYFFVNKNYEGKEEYDTGFGMNELFVENTTGIVTARDAVVIDFETNVLVERMHFMENPDNTDSRVRQKLFPGKKDGKYLAGDTRGWKLSEARKKILNNEHAQLINDISYRPFDIRKIYYTPDMIDWGREKVMQNFIKKENIGLGFTRQAIGDVPYSHILVTNQITDNRTFYSNKGIIQQAPLYLFSENQKIIPNLKKDIWQKMNGIVGETKPEDILDYIYAILHSPSYREKYQEFLKIDFPRVPYPEIKDVFWKLVEKGTELRELHLMKSVSRNDLITTYPEPGDNVVEKGYPKFEQKLKASSAPTGGENVNLHHPFGRVYINEEQFFDSVPKITWEFYIGGYQPAQKWLKDRRGRVLSTEDIIHYQKIIYILNETDRIMKEIDEIDFM